MAVPGSGADPVPVLQVHPDGPGHRRCRSRRSVPTWATSGSGRPTTARSCRRRASARRPGTRSCWPSGRPPARCCSVSCWLFWWRVRPASSASSGRRRSCRSSYRSRWSPSSGGSCTTRPATGLLNQLLGLVGLGPSGFINDPDTSLASIVVTGIWRGAPYDMMIFLAGLAGVDRGLYEAAVVDGASTSSASWHVTLPGAAAGVRDPVHARRDPRVARLHRGLPAHQRRAERLHRGADDPDLQARPRTEPSSGSPRPAPSCCFSATLVLTVCVQMLRRKEEAA